MATSGCKVDMKGTCLTFSVGECYVEFVLFGNQNIPSSSSALEEDMDFYKIGYLIIGGMMTLLCLNVLHLKASA